MQPFPFSEALAHPGDPLPLHLLRVAEQAAASVSAAVRPEIRLAAWIAGLFHDLGKATPYFQEYLSTHRKTRHTPHARCSAVLSWWYTGELRLPLWVRLAVLVSVLRHHGALGFASWRQPLEGLRCDVKGDAPELLEQLAILDYGGIAAWLPRAVPPGMSGFRNDHAPVVRPGPDAVIESVLAREHAGLRELRKPFPGLDEALAFLAAFGALLAADKVDAALPGALLPRRSLASDAVQRFKTTRFTEPMRPLDRRREAIAAAVEATWLAQLDAPLFTLTSPTGSGKTLAILNAALRVRAALTTPGGAPPRIVYCLPFTSVIDQNHEVFQAVLGARKREDLLLKHHHLVEGVFRTEGPAGEAVEHEADGAGQLLTETWQSEVVVTTFHQLLHSLLSARNGDLKRAGQLAGSIVLMDEVQAVPLRYWQALRHLFQSMARTLGTRLVLLTATRPLIFRPEDAVELLARHEEHFRALSRVRLLCHHEGATTLERFGRELAQQCESDPRPVLVILNRTGAVRELFRLLRDALPGRKMMALSTRLTPRDRRARIRLARRLLRAGEPVILVSSQLIEAGVDVSFPVVHRDLAPLDSVIQSAGRCNRNGAGTETGEVHLWELHGVRPDGSSSGPLWKHVYDSPLIEATREVLGAERVFHEREFLELSRRYFDACWRRQDQEPVEEALAAGDFPGLQRSFRLIEEGAPTRPVFVSARTEDERLWARYRAIRDDASLSPAEQEKRFRAMRRAFYERVVQVPGTTAPDEPVVRVEAGEGTYTRETGFLGFGREETSCIF